ncbi:hypothetical protein J7M23_01610 [Candidatus Sumerlaeota bacterium]|nr:hypothetical protein [Candidatus Sumerlaeota bacterium]
MSYTQYHYYEFCALNKDSNPASGIIYAYDEMHVINVLRSRGYTNIWVSPINNADKQKK